MFIGSGTITDSNFLIVELDNKMITKLDVKTSMSKNRYDGFLHHRYCYIPKISSIIKHSKQLNKSFDGIIGLCTEEDSDGVVHTNHCMFLIESEKIGVSNNEIIEVKLLKSKVKSDYCSLSKHIFCGPKYQIICANENGLTQLKFQQTNLTKNTFDLSSHKIDSNIKDIFKLTGSAFNNFDISMHYISMLYMPKNEKIFAMQCHKWDGMNGMRHSPRVLSKESACGIFSASDCKWIQLENWKYCVSENQDKTFDYQMCQNGVDMNSVFVVSNLSKIAKYDCNKNKWVVYYEPTGNHGWFNNVNNNCVWFDRDPFVLYRCYSKFYKSQLCFQYFDRRKRHEKWKEFDSEFITNELSVTGYVPKHRYHTGISISAI